MKQHDVCMKSASASASCQIDTADYQWSVYVGLVPSTIALSDCASFILSCRVTSCQVMLLTMPVALLHFVGAKAPCEQADVPYHAGESKPLPLKASISAFASGSADSVTVQAPELGPLTHIRLSHNAKGAHPDWMVEMVRIAHVKSAQEWLFFGHVWLHSGNDNQVVLKPGQSANHS